MPDNVFALMLPLLPSFPHSIPSSPPSASLPPFPCRCHHVKSAQRFYHKFRAVRDTLGLRYRFEMIFDDGSKPVTVSEHFTKRLSHWKHGGRNHGNLLPGQVTSYRELENLPCVVVLAGRNRSGLGFPRSVCPHLSAIPHRRA